VVETTKESKSMRVTLRTTPLGDSYEGTADLEIEVDERLLGCCVGNMSECPEDANLGRDLRFVLKIPDWLGRAHAAGVRGESFDLEVIEVDD
jgi:hypothetical protein